MIAMHINVKMSFFLKIQLNKKKDTCICINRVHSEIAFFDVKQNNLLFNISFTDGAKSTHIVQNMSFNLGHNITATTQGKNMATICKISRGYHMPPPFTSVQEWFHYAFATNDIKGEEDIITILCLFITK